MHGYLVARCVGLKAALYLINKQNKENKENEENEESVTAENRDRLCVSRLFRLSRHSMDHAVVVSHADLIDNAATYLGRKVRVLGKYAGR